MSDNIDQTAGGNAAPVNNDKGAAPEIKVDDNGSDTKNASDLEERVKGMQGSLQKEIEEKRIIAEQKAELEKKLREYEFEKLSETEKLQVKLKEAEEEKERLSREKEGLAIQTKWANDWNEIQKEFPNASELPVVKKKALENPGALGDQNAKDYDSWVTSVREELSQTEETLGKSNGGNPDFKKVNNTNSSSSSTGSLYEGLSPEEKLKRMRENIGVKSNW